ncbi:MAG: hypothetical protein ABSG63_11685 [Spirochaetia bacterium]|jgi:hypothetical protein
MKNAIKLSIALIVLLVALTGCSLYNGINLIWDWSNINPLAGNYYRVTYTVQNLGKVDLTGVNLLWGVDVNNDTYPEGQSWTSDFSISQGATLVNQTIDVYALGGVIPPLNAMVLSVDMDKPN